MPSLEVITAARCQFDRMLRASLQSLNCCACRAWLRVTSLTFPHIGDTPEALREAARSAASQAVADAEEALSLTGYHPDACFFRASALFFLGRDIQAVNALAPMFDWVGADDEEVEWVLQLLLKRLWVVARQRSVRWDGESDARIALATEFVKWCFHGRGVFALEATGVVCDATTVHDLLLCAFVCTSVCDLSTLSSRVIAPPFCPLCCRKFDHDVNPLCLKSHVIPDSVLALQAHGTGKDPRDATAVVLAPSGGGRAAIVKIARNEHQTDVCIAHGYVQPLLCRVPRGVSQPQLGCEQFLGESESALAALLGAVIDVNSARVKDLVANGQAAVATKALASVFFRVALVSDAVGDEVDLQLHLALATREAYFGI